MKQLGALCIGNGIGKKDLKLLGLEGSVAQITARVRIHPDITAQTQERRGRIKGDQMFKSREEMNAALENMKQSLAEKQDLMKKITDQVQARKDKGIVPKPQALKLKTLDKVFVCTNPCQSCKGSGKSGCPKCHGSKTVKCLRCEGERRVQCAVCQGSTTIAGPNGEQKPCPRCHGEGRISCDYCKGKGKIPCPQCKSSGAIKCRDCDGQGVYSSVARVEIQARLDCEIECGPLPEEICQKVETAGAGLLTRNLAKIQSASTGLHEDASGTKAPEIVYDLSLPHAGLEMKIGQKKVPLRMIGYRPEFLDIPPILDTTLAKAVSFSESTKAHFSPAQTLKQLGRYKIFRQAMGLVARKSVNAANRALASKYGRLISDETVQKIALQTNVLMGKATKKPERQATIWTAAIMAFLFGGYFIGPGQARLAGLLESTPNLAGLKDWASWGLLLAALFLTGPLHQALSKSFFNARMGKLLPREYAELLLSRMGKFKWGPPLWTILIFLCFYVPFEVLGFSPAHLSG